LTGKSSSYILTAFIYLLPRITKLEVVQEGETRIEPIRKFENAGLHPAVLNNVQLAGYIIPTPIQQYTIPAVLQGNDVVAVAQTGKSL
jgi:ATP-dependent RNA helicase DDX3X